MHTRAYICFMHPYASYELLMVSPRRQVQEPREPPPASAAAAAAAEAAAAAAWLGDPKFPQKARRNTSDKINASET